ncbi:hypothetical protein LTR41_006595 [Exophiala xenobiotica]|nr:hypothetical protein LTR41_006595 [Exophiala xenobiotica]
MTGEGPSSFDRTRRHCRFCNNFYQKHEHLIVSSQPLASWAASFREIPSDSHSDMKELRSFARLDTLGRHSKTHRYTSSPHANKFSASANVQNDQDDYPNESLDEEVWDWQPGQQEQQRIPVLPPDETASATAPMPTSHLDSMNPFPFNETEDMLQYLFATPEPTWTFPRSSSIGPPNSNIDLDRHGHVDQSSNTIPVGADEASPQALVQLNALIRETSAAHKRDMRRKGITCSFFDSCLSLFFSRFNPGFPILHEPTWTLQSTIPFLSLNMAAIGSLFIGAEDAVEKWMNVYDQNLREDTSNTQIVTCALLGQLYAMMSRSSRLRHIAQTVHGWPFSWAQKLGMFERQEFNMDSSQAMGMPFQDKFDLWKHWATLETSRRTLLGIFMVDSQLARFTGGVPIGKHLQNPLASAAPDSIFRAAKVDDWISEMKRQWKPLPLFRELYLTIFNMENLRDMPSRSTFSTAVLLEGVQAVILERRHAGGNAVGAPSERQIAQALNCLHNNCLETPATVNTLELHLRWHTLGLDLFVDSVQLFRRSCGQTTRQDVFWAGQKLSASTEDLNNWTKSVNARRSLLHAVAIQDLTERLPLGRSFAASTPSAVLAAATLYYAFCSQGQLEIKVPREVDWKMMPDDPMGSTSAGSRSQQFLAGQPMQSNYRVLNVRHSLLLLRGMLQTMSLQWGIAKEMCELLNPWTSFGTQ